MATFADNKKARFNFEFLETFEAGISLFGHEVKSIRANRADLTGSYVVIRGNEAFLVGATVQPYQMANITEKYDPDRPRKLLVTKKQLGILEAEEAKKGLTLVPISLYNKGRNIKLSFAIARGKKQFDKREKIKERDSKRDVARTLKNQ
jgi:SsrA-binding protein